MTRSFRFTPWTLQTLRPPLDRRRVEYRDTDVPSLYVRVTGRGTRTFSVVRRPAGGGRPRRITLGRFPQISVDEARRQARHLAGLQAGSERLADRRPVDGSGITVRQAFERFRLERIDASSTTPRYRREMDSVFRRLIEPEFGKRTLAEITRADVARWHGRLPERIRRERERLHTARDQARHGMENEVPERDPKGLSPPRGMRTVPTDGHRSANYALSVLRGLLRWAADAGLLTGDNPAAGIGRHREPKRTRVLHAEEVARLYQALAEEPQRDFFLLALFTGARRSALLSMRWSDLDLRLGEWHLDARRPTGSRKVLLVPEAVELLQVRFERMRAFPPGFVFPSRSRSGHLVDPHRAWQRVLARAGLEDIRIADLRRSLGVWQIAAGASLAAVADSLGQGSLQPAAAYARLARDPTRTGLERTVRLMLSGLR